jgi:hypothetical protein
MTNWVITRLSEFFIGGLVNDEEAPETNSVASYQSMTIAGTLRTNSLQSQQTSIYWYGDWDPNGKGNQLSRVILDKSQLSKLLCK